MKNETTIHVRMPEELRLQLNEEASKKGVSASSLIRDAISDSSSTSNPYHSTDFLFSLAYMEYYNDRYKFVCMYEVKHLLDIIKKHYPNLELDLQLLFDKVLFGLNDVLKLMMEDEDSESESIRFGSEVGDIQVDFDKFYELTDGRLPYR